MRCVKVQMRIRFLMDTVLCYATSLLVASPILSLPSAGISLGEVVAGDVGERFVELGNSGDAALHVSKVRACCGASDVLETPVLPPGTKGRPTKCQGPSPVVITGGKRFGD